MLNRLVTLLVLLGIASTGYLVFTNKQVIQDQIAVSRIEIDPAITQLVVNSGMNDQGLLIFHASNPSLEDAEGFNRSCTRQEERSAILGCYVNGRIYIYDIQDERLSGVREVTATHEALHAIYARLTEAEKWELEPLLEAEYNKVVLDDPAMQERMAYYERTQPGQRHNELHSIIGTEFSGLSGELERYYAKYFDDRAKVVELHQQYSHRFDEVRGGLAQLEADINALIEQVNSLSDQHNQAADNLGRNIDSFNARAQSGDFSSQAQFNSERSALLAESSRIEAQRALINDYINQYEQKIQEYNDLASESNSMYESLDSSLAPVPQI